MPGSSFCYEATAWANGPLMGMLKIGINSNYLRDKIF